jgi:O-antigen/teichoic acid export membrane protein
MNEYKLFLQRIGLISVAQLLTSLSAIALIPILTKNLPIEEYGLWVQTVATVSIFPGLVMLGLPYSMVRFLPSLNEKVAIQEMFYSILFLCVLTCGMTSLLFYIFSSTIAAILFAKNVFVVKIISLIIFFECSNSLFINYLRARQSIKKYSLSTLLKAILDILLVSFFVIVGKEICAAIIGLLISDISIFLVMIYLIIPDLGLKNPEFKNIKESLRFSIPTIPGNFSNWIVNSSDRYFIVILLGTASVGYYSPGYAMGSLIGIIFAPLSFLLPAALSKSYDENNLEEVKNFLSHSFKYIMIIAIPATFGVSLLSKPILNLLSTPEIASHGYLVTPFTALSALLFGIYGIIVEILFLEKRTLISGKIWTFAAMLNLGFNFVFIPYFGIMGAAITTLIAFAVSLILTIYYSFKSLKFDLNLEFISKSVISSILMSYTIYILKPEGLMSILLTIVICMPIYFGILYFLKGFDINEFNLLRNFMKN